LFSVRKGVTLCVGAISFLTGAPMCGCALWRIGKWNPSSADKTEERIREDAMRPVILAVVVCFSLATLSLSAADNPQLDKIMAAYKAKLASLNVSLDKQKGKLRDEVLKKLKALRTSKMRAGHLDAANAVDAKIKELERPESAAGATGPDGEIGGIPLPPGAEGKDAKGDKKRFRKTKDPEELKSELMSVNPGYDGRGGRFDVEGGAIVEVDLEGCNIVDLSPLANLKFIRELYVADNPLWDLSPIAKLHPRYISLRRTNVSDLSSLKGMQLLYLDISKTNVRDISVVKSMPLVTFRMEGDVFINDLSPMKKLKTLKTLILPPHVFKMDIDFARKFKNIKVIDTRSRAERDLRSPAEFWAEYDKKRGGG